MLGVSPSPKLDGEHVPLGSTKIYICISLEHFEEDQRFGGRNILDLMNTSQIKVRRGGLGTRT